MFGVIFSNFWTSCPNTALHFDHLVEQKCSRVFIISQGVEVENFQNFFTLMFENIAGQELVCSSFKNYVSVRVSL